MLSVRRVVASGTQPISTPTSRRSTHPEHRQDHCYVYVYAATTGPAVRATPMSTLDSDFLSRPLDCLGTIQQNDGWGQERQSAQRGMARQLSGQASFVMATARFLGTLPAFAVKVDDILPNVL